MILNLEQLARIQQAREKLITTAVAMGKLMRASDDAYGVASSEAAPVRLMRKANKLSLRFEAAERAHFKAIADYFNVCRLLNVDPS